ELHGTPVEVDLREAALVRDGDGEVGRLPRLHGRRVEVDEDLLAGGGEGRAVRQVGGEGGGAGGRVAGGADGDADRAVLGGPQALVVDLDGVDEGLAAVEGELAAVRLGDRAGAGARPVAAALLPAVPAGRAVGVGGGGRGGGGRAEDDGRGARSQQAARESRCGHADPILGVCRKPGHGVRAARGGRPFRDEWWRNHRAHWSHGPQCAFMVAMPSEPVNLRERKGSCRSSTPPAQKEGMVPPYPSVHFYDVVDRCPWCPARTLEEPE